MTSPVLHMPERVIQVGTAPSMPKARDRARATAPWDEYIMYVSMALLLISTIQGIGLIGDAVKVVWLASVVLLTAINAGAALGVYIAALSLFAVVHYDGLGPAFGRPDYYALLILVAGLAIRMALNRASRTGPGDRATLLVVGFVGYGLLQTALMGVLTRSVFMIYLWMPGLPMMMFLLVAQYGLSSREFRALVCSLLVLGSYMALVSIAERVGWHDLIVPAWIADPSLTSILPGLGPSTVATGEARSGGLLMQPAWNGLALSLIYCVAILSFRMFNRRSGWLLGIVALLCLVGVFFSETRASWLACALASLALLSRPSKTRAKTRLKRFGVVSASIIVILALVVLPDTSARQRIGESGTVFYRFNLWKVALSMAAARPLFGSGFTTFDDQVSDYQDEMTLGCQAPGQVTCLNGRMNIDNDAAHNTVLSMLVELGAIGLVLYFGALMVIFRRARTAALELWGREGAVWVAVFFGVYFLQAQFAVAHEPTTNLMLFGLLGAVAGLVRRAPPGQLRGVRSLRLRADAQGKLARG